MHQGVSHGLAAHSYDVRLSDQFTKIMDKQGLIRPDDPIRIGYNAFVLTPIYTLDPGQFVLASTIERVEMPNDLTATVKDKSTYARYGIAVQNTFIDAGFRGHITLEISNHGPCPVALLIGCGVAQLVFTQCSPCEVPYAGKYQDQEGTTPAR